MSTVISRASVLKWINQQKDAVKKKPRVIRTPLHLPPGAQNGWLVEAGRVRPPKPNDFAEAARRAAIKKYRSDIPARARDAAAAFEKVDIALVDAQERNAGAYEHFMDKLRPLLSKNEPLARAFGAWYLKRTELDDAACAAVVYARTALINLGIIADRHSRATAGRALGGNKRGRKPGIDFEKYRKEFFELIGKRIKPRTAAAQLKRKYNLPKSAIDTMPRYFKNKPNSPSP